MAIFNFSKRRDQEPVRSEQLGVQEETQFLPEQFVQLLRQQGYTTPDIQRAHRLLAFSKITITCETKGVTGRPYFTFMQNNSPIELSAHTATAQLGSSCLGFIVHDGIELAQSVEHRRTRASEVYKNKHGLSSGELHIFSSGLFETILDAIASPRLAKAMELSPSAFDQVSAQLRQYGSTLRLEYYGETPLALFWNVERGAVQDFGPSTTPALCLGLIMREPNETTAQFLARKQRIERKYADFVADPFDLERPRRAAFLEFTPENWLLFLNSIDKKQKAGRDLATAQITQSVGNLDKMVSLAGRVLNTKATQALGVVPHRLAHERQQLGNSIPDVIFIDKEQKDAVRVKQVTLLGYVFPKTGRDEPPPEKFEHLDHVCGILVVPDETSIAERKRMATEARSYLGKLYPLDPSAVVVAADNRLIRAWKKVGVLEVMRASEQTPRLHPTQQPKIPEILRPSTVESIQLRIREPKGQHIGGTQLTYIVRLRTGSGRLQEMHVPLDRGWIFDLVPQWNGIGSGPSYNQGLAPYLEKDMWGLEPEVYRLDLLLRSLRPAVLAALQNCVESRGFADYNEFIGMELYRRLGKEGLHHALRTTDETREFYQPLNRTGKLSQNAFWSKIARKAELIYDGQDRVVPLAILSHAHQDHSVGFSFLADHITRGFSPVTRSLLISDFFSSSSWATQEVVARRMRELNKVGSAYPVFEYPQKLLIPNTRVPVAPNLYVSTYSVEHSVPGAVAVKLEYEEKSRGLFRGKRSLGSVFYPGDYKNTAAFSEVSQDGKLDLLIAEGTNAPNARTHKDSVHHTEDTVRRKFAELCNDVNTRKELLIVDVVKNNFERLEGIIAEATARGRTVVLSPKIAVRYQRRRLLELTMSENESLVDLSRPDIMLWKRAMQEYPVEHRTLFAQYGSVGVDVLSRAPNRFVLIRESHESVGDIGSISAPTTWVRSVYGDYDAGAVQYTQECQRVARSRGWRLFREGFHATGHAPLHFADDPRAKNGVLEAVAQVPAEKILIVHTHERGKVAQALQSYNPAGKIITRVNHQGPQEIQVWPPKP